MHLPQKSFAGLKEVPSNTISGHRRKCLRQETCLASDLNGVTAYITNTATAALQNSFLTNYWAWPLTTATSRSCQTRYLTVEISQINSLLEKPTTLGRILNTQTQKQFAKSYETTKHTECGRCLSLITRLTFLASAVKLLCDYLQTNKN